MPKTILQGHTLKRKQDAQGFWYHVELAGASVEIRDESTGALAPLWADRDGTIGMPNPFTSDSEARFETYTNPGHYRARAFDGSGNEVIVNYIRQGTAASKDYGTATGQLPEAQDVYIRGGGDPIALKDQSNVFTALQMILFGDPTDTDDQLVIGRADAPAANNPTMTFKIDNTLPTISTWDGTQNVGLRLASPIQVGLPTAVPGGAPLGSLNAEHIYVGGRRVNANEPLQVVTPNGWNVVKLGENGEITQTGFSKYVVEIVSLTADTDGAQLIMRTSSDGGSTFDSGASDYATVVMGRDGGSGDAHYGNDNMTEIRPTGALGVGNAAGENLSAEIWISDPTNAALETLFGWNVEMVAPDTAMRVHRGSGRRKQAAVVNALEFTLSSGNIASGTFKLYGVP